MIWKLLQHEDKNLSVGTIPVYKKVTYTWPFSAAVMSAVQPLVLLAFRTSALFSLGT